MSRRDSGPKRRAEAWAQSARDEIGIGFAPWVRAALVKAYLAGYRSAARARRKPVGEILTDAERAALAEEFKK